MSKSIISTAAIYAGGSVIAQILGLASQVILMRGLSLHDYGFYGLSFEVLIMLQMVAGGAFRNFYLQKFRKGDDDLNSLTQYQFVNGSLCIALFSFILYIAYGVDFYISISLTLSFILTSFALPLQTQFLLVNKRIPLIVKDISTAIVSLLMIIISVKVLSLPIRWVIMLQLIPAAAVSLLYMIIYQRDFFTNTILCGIFKQKVKLEKVLFVFMGVFLINTLHNKLGVLYIKTFSELAVLAIYIGAFKFINPTLFIQSSLIAAFMPKFVNDDNFKFERKIFFIFFIPGLLVSLSLYFLFPYVIQILGLHSYKDAYPVVKIGCWFVLIVFIYGALSNYISVRGGQKFVLVTNIFGLVFYVLALAALSWFFKSTNIALEVTYCFVLAESFICVFYYFYIKKHYLHISLNFLLTPIFVISLVSLLYLR